MNINKYLPKFTQINICRNISENYDCDNNTIRGEKYNNKFVDNINFIGINPPIEFYYKELSHMLLT